MWRTRLIPALKEVEAGESEAQGHLCLYNELEASVSYRGPGLKENKKRKPRRLCWESWLKAKAGADAQSTGPQFSKSQERGGVVLYGRVFSGAWVWPEQTGAVQPEQGACMELAGQASRGRDLGGGRVRRGGASRGQGRRPRRRLQCGAPVCWSSLLPARLVVGGSGPPLRLGP